MNVATNIEGNPVGNSDSPFHEGEQRLQSRVGKREVMEQFGRQVIRNHMPEQHRQFFSELRYLVVGGVDKDGWPWASLLTGCTGFIHSPDPWQLEVNAVVNEIDPLASCINEKVPVGLLGIDLSTRRRNRLNARVIESSQSGFSVSVDQSFGNCPQYIQARQMQWDSMPGKVPAQTHSVSMNQLDAKARSLIENSDTFFVSSYINSGDNPEKEGVDVSHRGGKPGFVKVDGNRLTVPDFSGNNHFNTLGNFLLNPKAGLLFVDFKSGDLLMLTGTVELLFDGDSDVAAFQGAERAWRFTLENGIRLTNGLPFRAGEQEYSPSALLTGNWAVQSNDVPTEKNLSSWQRYRVFKVEDESSVIRSFYLEPEDKLNKNCKLPPFKAGQFLTVKVTEGAFVGPLIRTYTISSSPADPYYRISVKKELEGQVSSYLHEVIKSGDVIEVMAPRGDFFIDPNVTRPAVLLAGGVGITPMIAMAQHIINQAGDGGSIRPLTILHSAKTTQQRAFYKNFRNIERQAGGAVRYYSFVSSPSSGEILGKDFYEVGHFTPQVFRQLLALDDYDFYLCGPELFMLGNYKQLKALGVSDKRVFTESFGTSFLSAQSIKPIKEADKAIVNFRKSSLSKTWLAGDATLLETAESLGISPEFGCRQGSCGACAVKLNQGEVAYRTKPVADVNEKDVLLCCAVPAEGTQVLELDI